MTSATPIPDAAERELALDVSRSFIVQAPAGSGKTELLVQRYMRLLATVDKPEEIVAITFTRKAAAEMRKRVLGKMDPELAPRLRIQTIDALCTSLTSRMPVLARFGAQPGVTEDASELYREAAARALADITPPVARLLAHLDNDVGQANALLAGMLGRRDQWLRQTGSAPTRAELEATLVAERERLIARPRAYLPDASPELAEDLLTKKGEWRKKNKRAQELSGNEPLRAALAALLRIPPAAYGDEQWEALEAILALLQPAVAQLFALFGERGEVDFTQISHGALQALGTPDEPTDLLLSLDARVRHLLVDEFQDTSNSQWELLERLTSGWQDGDGRTVFVVGDPMQSIYRFRDAQVGLFLHARRAGLPGVRLHPLTLSTNFRSQAKIVEWVNARFPRVLPAAEDESSGAVPYSPSVPLHEPEPDGEPTLDTFPDREGEALRVVECLREAAGRTAILVRNRKHLDAIVPALKAAGLRFRAVEIEQLGEKQVVQDLYALTRALTHLGDRVAWLAILRAPWCGLTLEDLSTLFEGRADRTIWELLQERLETSAPVADGRGVRLARLHEILAHALGQRMRGTLRDRVEGTWLALGGPACVEDVTGLEDAEVFLDELERLEVAGELEDFSALGESLKKLYAMPDVNAGPGAVQIMTIHKAKGLEFDTVIVPGLDRAPRSGNKPLLAWRSLPYPAGRETGGEGTGDKSAHGMKQRALLLAPIDETGGDDELLYQYVRTLDREAEDIEAGRLLYVAATRAKSRLHLMGCLKLDTDGTPKRPGKRSLLGIAWDSLPELPTPLPAANGLNDVASVAGGGAGSLYRLADDFNFPDALPPVAWGSIVNEREDAEQVEFSWAGETARHVGTVVHRWLQRIADDALKGWSEERIDALVPAFRADLQRRGVPPAEIDAATLLVRDALANAIADERGRWVLSAHAKTWTEYRIRTRDGRRLVVDRRIVTADGAHWVVDYKTSRHEGANPEAFLNRERERYAAQLARYAQALGGAHMGLYFPVLKGWREWDE